MKLGAQGFIAYEKKEDGSYVSQSFPALSANPVDVSGAGDSLLAIMATGLSSGEDIMSTAALGCCMCALSVERMGNNPISKSSLQDAVFNLFKD